MVLKNLVTQLISLFSGILCARFRNVAIFTLPGPIMNGENITRFLFQGDITKKKELKTQSFKPRKSDRQLSVYRLSNFLNDVKIRIGCCFVEKRRRDGKRLVGMVDLHTRAIRQVNQGIFLKRTFLPHPRHANIHFPPNSSYLENERWKTIAKALIAKSNRPTFVSTSERSSI